MNDDTNKNLDVNPSEGIQDNFKIDVKVVETNVNPAPVSEVVSNDKVESDVNNANNNVDVTKVEETVINDNEVKVEVNNENVVGNVVTEAETSKSEANVVSETVIAADINSEVKEEVQEMAVGTIDEVSVTVDSNAFNTINDNEISDKSVFKKVDVENENASMKEGQELKTEKKGFPFFMVLIFIIVVVAAFFIDDISLMIKEYKEEKNKNNNTVEESNDTKKEESPEVKARELTLTEVKDAIDNSTEVINFAKDKNIEISSHLEANSLIYTTTNYIDPTNDNTTFKVEYTFSNNVLSSECDLHNSEFGRQMSIFIVKEIAKLQGVTSSDIDNYLNTKIDTNTLDNGFEFITNEDGSTSYKIATNIKIDINK